MNYRISETRNINIRYDLPQEVWDKVPDVYKNMDGWLGFGDGKNGMKDIPYWYSFEENQMSISVSVEPSGLQFSALNINEEKWNSWLSSFKKKATEVLGFKVGEIEEGEVGYELEWIK
jgi:hypothetical protein